MKDAYKADRDIELFSDQPLFWMYLNPGDFAVFFPYDRHVPSAGSRRVNKVIIKIPLHVQGHI